MSLSEKLREAKAIAARLGASADVPAPSQQNQRTSSAAAGGDANTVGSGSAPSATSCGTAMQPAATPGASQQPAASGEAELAVRPWMATADVMGGLDHATLKRLAAAWKANLGFTPSAMTKAGIVKSWADKFGLAAAATPPAAAAPQPPSSAGSSLAANRAQRKRAAPAPGATPPPAASTPSSARSTRSKKGGSSKLAAALVVSAATGGGAASVPTVFSPGMQQLLRQPRFVGVRNPPESRGAAVLDPDCPTDLFEAARSSLRFERRSSLPLLAPPPVVPRGPPPAPTIGCPEGIIPAIYEELAPKFDDISARAVQVALLLPILPPDAVVRMHGGQARHDAAAPEERDRALQRKLLSGAGKAGSTAASIRSLLEGPYSLRAYVDAKLGTTVAAFPCTAARSSEYCAWRAATSAATAAGGGHTVAANAMSTLSRGRSYAGLDIDVESAVADGIAPQQTDAGESCGPNSLYLMCSHEDEARHAPTHAARYFNRELVIADHHSMRKAQLDRSAKHLPGASASTGSVCLEVSLTKDGSVKDRSAMPTSGFLGPFDDWMDEHLTDRAAVMRVPGKEPSTFPHLVCAKGHADDPYHASARLDFSRPNSDGKTVKAIAAITARAGISKARQKAVRLTKHSAHSALTDLASRLRWRSEVLDHLGKWAVAEARAPGARPRSRGAAGRKRVMRARYTSDAALENQVDIRERLVEAVKTLLDTSAWHSFPRESNTQLFAGVPNLLASPYYGAAAI